MIPLVLHHDCNGDSLVRCGWTSNQDIDGLARQVKADLSQVADLPVRTQCSDIRGRVSAHLRSCLIQVADGSHAVTIFLDPYVRTVDAQSKLLGSQYIVTAG